jgi:HEAT repeat protein
MGSAKEDVTMKVCLALLALVLGYGAGRLSAEEADVPALVRKLSDPDADVRGGAARRLWSLGPAAKEAKAALAEALEDPDLTVKRFAEACLRGLELDVPALVKKLGEPDPGDRMEALGDFAALAPFAREAIPAVIRLVDDKERVIRLRAVAVVAGLGPNAKDAVPGLIRRLDDEAPEIRLKAVGALGGLGEAARDAIPALLPWLRKESAEKVASALRRIGFRDFAVLAAQLKDSDVEVRKRALLALEQFGLEARETVPAVLEALKDPNSSVRAASIRTLGRIGGPSPEARAALIERLKDESQIGRAHV